MKTVECKPKGLKLRIKPEISLNCYNSKNSKSICHIEKQFSVHCSPSRALSFDVAYSMKF